MALGARLRELRIRNRQSLQDVADAVGISKAHLWELEKGTSKNPSMELLTKLANHFKVSVAYLVGEDPTAANEDPELIAMYRELKELDPAARETVHMLMKRLKPAKDEEGGS